MSTPAPATVDPRSLGAGRAKPWRQYCLQALLLTLLLPLLFPGVFLSGEVIAPGDILFLLPPWSHHAPEGFERPQYPLAVDPVAAFLPWYALSTEAIKNSEWPLWNHLELGGLPLLANLQSAVLYPPRIVHLFFSLGVATTLFILFKVWWCGMAAYFCGRGIGLRPGTARFFSVAWMMSAYTVVWCNWPLADVAGWLPILFLGVEHTLSQRYRSGFFILVMGGTLLLYAGHPETGFRMGLGLGLYLIGRILFDRRRGVDLFKPVAIGTAAAAAATGLCAALLLPFAEYLSHSLSSLARPGMEDELTLPFSAFIGFWVPQFFGTSAEDNFWGSLDSNLYSMIYPGIAVWLGVFLLLARGRLPGLHRNRVLALLFPAFADCAMAGSIPPFDLVHRLPVFDMMLRCHHLGFPVFALPLLGAIGIEHWTARPRRTRELLSVLLPLLAVGALVWLLYRHNAALIDLYEVSGFLFAQISATVFFTVAGMGLLVLGLWWGERRQAYLLPLLTLLLVADLGFASRNLNPTLPSQHLFPPTRLTDHLRALEPAPRVNAAMASIPGGFPVPYGIEQWGGYDGIYPERMMVFQEKLGTGIWKNMEPICAVDTYLHDRRYPAKFPADAPGRFTLTETLDGIEVYKNNLAFPRAFLAGGLELMDHTQLFACMMADGYDPAEYVIAEPTAALNDVPETLQVDDPVEVPYPDTPYQIANGWTPLPENMRSTFAPFAGTAEVTLRTSTRVIVEAEAERDAVLVLTDAYFPGWKATVDGKPAELFPAYYAFRGLILPPGKHTVEYTYFPSSFAWGLTITLLTLALLIAIGCGMMLSSRGSTARKRRTP